MDNQELEVRNSLDENNMPAGGYIKGVGLNINWQDGPLGTGERRQSPNGTFVETVVRAAVKRLEFYQSTQFECGENEEAIRHLKSALTAMARRTASRESRGVEGTHSK
jgi:hypothetical protein